MAAFFQKRDGGCEWWRVVFQFALCREEYFHGLTFVV
jgi:hypothetical protein